MEVTNINVANAAQEKMETLRGLYAIDLKAREYSRVTRRRNKLYSKLWQGGKYGCDLTNIGIALNPTMNLILDKPIEIKYKFRMDTYKYGDVDFQYYYFSDHKVNKQSDNKEILRRAKEIGFYTIAKKSPSANVNIFTYLNKFTDEQKKQCGVEIFRGKRVDIEVEVKFLCYKKFTKKMLEYFANYKLMSVYYFDYKVEKNKPFIKDIVIESIKELN